MKALVSLILAVALVGGVYLATTSGCGARGAVLKDKIVEKYDSLLGKLDIQKKEIEIAFNDLKKRTGNLKNDQIRAQVKLEDLSNQKKLLMTKMETIDANLKKLQPMLEAAKDSGSFTAESSEKEISLETLKNIADTELKKRKAIKRKLEGKLSTLLAAYTKNLDFLSKQATLADKELKNLDEKIADIDAQMDSIAAVKEASLLAGPGESIADQFEDLNKKTDALLGEVKVEMRIEDAKIDDRIAEMDSEDVSIEDLLKDDTDISGTLSEIDAILNGGSGE